MIDYETFHKIKYLNETEKLSPSQIANKLGMNRRTVSFWLKQPNFTPRTSALKTSKLDPFKPTIVRLLEQYPYSVVQLLNRLREDGYDGGETILRSYVNKVRPPKAPAFLTLTFAPGECAQVDWGEFGTVSVGETKRKLSFFVMVLCYSRMIYVEFTVLQRMEHFLTCHQNAFDFFGGVPKEIMVDNLKSAVLKNLVGAAPVLNSRYLDFARHYGFKIKPCAPKKPNEKGRVECGVDYVKKNLLRGLEPYTFPQLGPVAAKWRDEVANVRLHKETKKRPGELFLEEEPALQLLPENRYDCGVTTTLRATTRFRINVDANRYSVPHRYAGKEVLVRTYPDRLVVYHDDQLIAQHPRSYDRNRDFEDPEHVKELLNQRKKARAQVLLGRFLALSPKAHEYHQQLSARRMNASQHVERILTLADIHGKEKVGGALEEGLRFSAFSAEYVANLLECRSKFLQEPRPLVLTRRQYLLDIDIPAPDLSIYEQTSSTIYDQEDSAEGTGSS